MIREKGWRGGVGIKVGGGGVRRRGSGVQDFGRRISGYMEELP